MSVSYPTKLILAYRSGDLCALPGCRRHLLQNSDGGDLINVGVAAHIAGEHDGKGTRRPSARFDPNMTDEERNHHNNLIYLCPTCHEKIDSRPGERDYPVERLQKIKVDHEKKVREAVADAFANVSFPELAEITQWLQQVDLSQLEIDFSLIPLEAKLKKNDLGTNSQFIITMGLSIAPVVKDFVESFSQTDPQFSDRLKFTFLEEYARLKKDGHNGDELFDLMCHFSQQGFRENTHKAAGLAVLTFLFEACEVFEK